MVKEAEEINRVHEKSEGFSLMKFFRKIFATDPERENITPDQPSNVYRVDDLHSKNGKLRKVQEQ